MTSTSAAHSAGSTVQVDAVLFDLDGTLIDTKGLYFEAYRQAVQPFVRKDLTPARIRAMRPTSEIEFLRAVVADRDFETCLDRFYAVYEELHADRFGGVFPGITELLETLRTAGLGLGLVTGKSRRSWEITRAVARGLGAFDTLVFDDDVRAPKPDPHGLELAVAALAVEPGRAAYVGDTFSDVQAARQAGLRPVAALWARDPEERPAHVERVRAVDATVIERPADLLSVLALD